jgi:hypothetical protein
MRLVREFAFLVAMLLLAAVPVIGVGCTDQSATNTPAGEHVDTVKKSDTKTSAPKPAKKKGRAADDSGSTTGDLGVKPPKVPATNTSK